MATLIVPHVAAQVKAVRHVRELANIAKTVIVVEFARSAMDLVHVKRAMVMEEWIVITVLVIMVIVQSAKDPKDLAV